MKLPYGLTVLSLFAGQSAIAHDQWLEVEPFRAATGSRAKVYLLVGEHYAQAEPVRIRDRGRLKRFAFLSGAGTINLLPRTREDQEPIVLIEDLGKGGTSMIVAEISPREIELEASKFQEYLLEERLIDILASRAEKHAEDAPGRERYSRSMKAIFQVGGAIDAWVVKPIGQELEIVPAVNPYAIKPGGALTVQVLFRGSPLVKRAVTAANRHRANIRTRTVRTDSDGRATFTLDRSGDWMIRLVHVEESRELGVDWRSWWSSLTFQISD
jgi:uncharacterized GH25 family protein